MHLLSPTLSKFDRHRVGSRGTKLAMEIGRTKGPVRSHPAFQLL